MCKMFIYAKIKFNNDLISIYSFSLHRDEYTNKIFYIDYFSCEMFSGERISIGITAIILTR